MSPSTFRDAPRRETNAPSCGRLRLTDLIGVDAWLAIVQALRLSQREADVLRSFFESHEIASIARNLGLSRDTVHTYRGRLFAKLRVHSVPEAMTLVFATYLDHQRIQSVRPVRATV